MYFYRLHEFLLLNYDMINHDNKKPTRIRYDPDKFILSINAGCQCNLKYASNNDILNGFSNIGHTLF